MSEDTGTVTPLIAAFKQSISSDTEANRVRIVEANAEMNYDVVHSEIRPVPTPDADGFTRINLAALPISAGLDGTFDVGITAVDERGQESPFLMLEDGNFDFSPPVAPTEGQFEDGGA
jgi:hypothetical protein